MPGALPVLILACLLACASAHSWVGCSDYTGDFNNYDVTKCRGFPREFSKYAGATLGEQRGYNYVPSENKACIAPLGDASTQYTAQYPMATYSTGQKVCLAWPAQNHVADTCTNAYIPDTGLFVYISAKNPTQDGTLTQFKTRLVADVGGHVNGQIDHKGYQNCPNFCKDMVGSVCQQCFTVPATLETGTYTFMWYWQFNSVSLSDTYTSCWEAKVTAGANTQTGGSSQTGPDAQTNEGSLNAGGGGGSSNAGGAAAAVIIVLLVVVAGVVGSVIYVKRKKPLMYSKLSRTVPFLPQ